MQAVGDASVGTSNVHVQVIQRANHSIMMLCERITAHKCPQEMEPRPRPAQALQNRMHYPIARLRKLRHRATCADIPVQVARVILESKARRAQWDALVCTHRSALYGHVQDDAVRALCACI
jgi:hypothetical protein